MGQTTPPVWPTSARAKRETQHIKTMTEPAPNETIEEMCARLGIPLYRMSMPENVYAHIHALEGRKAIRRHNRQCRRRAYQRSVERRVAHDHEERLYVRSWRSQYPWHVRYPNLARVVWWTLVIAVVAFFILADRIATYLPQH